jgi:phage/plasmid-like protein (TIGR03299 family)
VDGELPAGRRVRRRRHPGWHRLGKVYKDQLGLTAQQVMEDAKLGGWNVRKIGSLAVLDPITGQFVTSDDDFMILRTNPVTGNAERLGMAGNWWAPIQNEQHCDFLNALLDGGAGFDTAMSLLGGKTVVITMKLPESVKIAGVDQIDLYVAVVNHHGGHGSFTVIISPIRVVCRNTLAAALANFVRMIKIRHTMNATASIEKAREVLGLSYDYLGEFHAEAERMIQQTLTAGGFEKVVAEVFPLGGKTKMAATMFSNRTAELMTLFNDAERQANCQGTNWAGFQAIVEYADFRLPFRGADDPAAARAQRSLLGEVDDIKEKAFRLLRVPA